MHDPIDMKQKVCELIWHWTYYMTLTFDPAHELDLGFSRSNFEVVISEEQVVLLARNEKDMNQYHVRPTIWPWLLTLPMTLTSDFQD